MTEILFCDVDGTLTGTVSGATFKSNPRDVLVLPGLENALAHYTKEGYLMLGISNEGEVGAVPIAIQQLESKSNQASIPAFGNRTSG